MQRSLESAIQLAAGFTIKTVDPNSGRSSSEIIVHTALHIVQDWGRGDVSIHDKRLVGERPTIEFARGKATVSIREARKNARTYGNRVT